MFAIWPIHIGWYFKPFCSSIYHHYGRTVFLFFIVKQWQLRLLVRVFCFILTVLLHFPLFIPATIAIRIPMHIYSI